jgi:hypothetical protein
MSDLRTADGRFASKSCGDPNCSGEMVADFDRDWCGVYRDRIIRCDGLTYFSETGPLFACTRQERAAQ